MAKHLSSTVLLQSKLLPPRLPSSLVARPRLLQWLDEAIERKMTLLVAPAGSGKTTLVTQWMHECRIQGQLKPVAWLSLESGDNDLFRFWRSLIAACQVFQKGIGQTTLASLTDALQPPFVSVSLEATLTLLLNELTLHVQDGLLVLDDYHFIEEPTLLKTWTFFLDHLPPTLGVLLLTRSEPLHLPLLRWRASGDVSELHTADLRFSFEETAIFTRQALSAPLPAAALTQIDALLQGWPAGLRLLLLTLSEQKMPQAINYALPSFPQCSDLAFPYEALRDYLVTEILDAQPAPRQRFLLQTSVLSRLNASLCAAVTGEEDCDAQLAAIEQAGLFLEALDGGEGWYHFHTLWSSAMRREAARRLGEETLRMLSRQASVWYAQQAMTAEAVEAALFADDVEHAAALIESMGEDGRTAEFHMVRRWVEVIPEATLRTHPFLCWLASLSLLAHREETPLSSKESMHVNRLLQMAEEGSHSLDEPTFPGLILAVRAMSAWRQGPSNDALMYAQQALAALSEHRQDHRMPQMFHLSTFRAICLFIVGSGYMYAGRFDEARSLLLDAYAHSLSGDDRHMTRGMLLLVAACCAALDELHLAHEYYLQTLDESRRYADRAVTAKALLGLAHISYEWNQLAEAEQQVKGALAVAAEDDADVQYQSALYLALLAYARGHLTSAQQQITALVARLSIATTYEAALRLPDVLLVSARLALETGDIQVAKQAVAVSQSTGSNDSDDAAILRARILLADHAPREAVHRLKSLVPVIQQRRQAIELRILLSLAYAANQEEDEARRWLQQALVQARSEGFVRLFLIEGEPLIRLLRQLVPTLQEREVRSFAQKVLRAFVQTDIEPLSGMASSAGRLIEPLSLQEQRVLQLLMAGETNQQIAQHLVVSVNTVKDHLKHLYRKLGVNTRLQASEVGRQLHLLP